MIGPAAGRRLTRAELRAVVSELAPQPERWRHHVRHDARQRVFHELARDDFLSVWVISWMAGQDTGLHDQGHSSGAVAVASGLIREDRLPLGGELASGVYAPGELLDFDPGVVHRIRQEGSSPAVTLHAYSPPLGEVSAYLLDDDGQLIRRPRPDGEELRPLAVAPGSFGACAQQADVSGHPTAGLRRCPEPSTSRRRSDSARRRKRATLRSLSSS